MSKYKFTHPSGYSEKLDIEDVLEDLKVFMTQGRRFNVRIHSTRKGNMKKVVVSDRSGHVWTYRKVKKSYVVVD